MLILTENEKNLLTGLISSNSSTTRTHLKNWSKDGTRYRKKEASPEKREEWQDLCNILPMNDRIIVKLNGVTDLTADEKIHIIAKLRRSLESSQEFLLKFNEDGTKYKNGNPTKETLQHKFNQVIEGIPRKKELILKFTKNL